MPLSLVSLTADSWVQPESDQSYSTRLLSEEETRNLTRDFACFHDFDFGGVTFGGGNYYWMRNNWYNLNLPLAGAPDLTADNMSTLLEFRFSAIRYSYKSQPEKQSGKLFGRWFNPREYSTYSASPSNCDLITVLIGNGLLPVQQRVEVDEDPSILGDFLLAEEHNDAGMIVLRSEILVIKSEDGTSSLTSLPSTASTSLPSTTTTTRSGTSKMSHSVVIAVSIGGVLAFLFALIGIALISRRCLAKRRPRMSPVPPPVASASHGPSKVESAYAALMRKPHPLEDSRTTLNSTHGEMDEEERVLRELRGAMQTSGFTVNTLFARLTGPSTRGEAGTPDGAPVLPAYEREH